MRYRGFTFMELLVVLMFGLILYGLTVSFGVSSLSIQEMDRTVQVARSELSLARNRALSGKSSASWGVYFATSSIIQFQGASYAARVQSRDLSTPLSAGMSITGTKEYVFTAPYGDPTSSGTSTFSYAGRTRVLSVNAYGMIEVQ